MRHFKTHEVRDLEVAMVARTTFQSKNYRLIVEDNGYSNWKQECQPGAK